MKNANRRNRSGFGFIEVAISMVIGAVLIVSAVKGLMALGVGMSMVEMESSDLAEVGDVINQLKRDLILAGSDPTPRKEATDDLSGFALGRLDNAGAQARRGVLPLGLDSVQILSYRPFDKDGDGLIEDNEGICTTVQRIDSGSFRASDPACYDQGLEIGSINTYIPLKAQSRDNLQYQHLDSNGDGVKDALSLKNLGNYRSTSDDGEVQFLLHDVDVFKVFYVFDDHRIVFFDGAKASFNDGYDPNISNTMRDTIREVIIELSVKVGERYKTYKLQQRLSIRL